MTRRLVDAIRLAPPGTVARYIGDGDRRLAEALLDYPEGDTAAASGRDLLPCLTIARMSPAPITYALIDAGTVYPCPACRAWALTVGDDVLAELTPLEVARAVEEALVDHAHACPPLRQLAADAGARWPA